MQAKTLLLLVLAFSFLGFSSKTTFAAPQPVKLQLKWTHQFQFAGYYMAKAKGYYQKAGLDVEFLEGNAEIDPVEAVLKGQAQFGVGTTELLQNFNSGDPVVVLGVIFQHSPLALLVTDPSIQTPTDLKQKKLMIEDNSAELYAFLKRHQLSKRDFIHHRHKQSIKDLMAGNIDALSVYTTTEPFELKQKGIDYRIFKPYEADIDFYGDNLFTTQEMLDASPEVVDAFRKASFEGWQYAMANIEETVRHILSHYVTELSYEALHFEAQEMIELMNIDRIYPGNMTERHWQQIAETYAEQGFLEHKLDLDHFIYHPASRLEAVQANLNNTLIVLGFFILLAIALMIGLYKYHRLNAKYATLITEAPISIILIDEAFNIVEWNDQASETFEWQAKEVIGRNIFDLIVALHHKDKVKQALTQVIAKQEYLRIENANLTKSGNLIQCDWSNAPYEVNGQSFIICMAQQLSDAEAENTLESSDNGQTDPMISEGTNTEVFRNKLVELLSLSVEYWHEETGKSKVDLAEESQLWRVTLDGGTAKTRTLDKYLSSKTIPKNPRWRAVIQTCNFVLKQTNDLNKSEKLAQLKKALLTMVQ